MIHVSATAAALLNILTAGLCDPCSSDGKSSRKLGTDDDAYMPLTVERIGPACYSLAHYGTQNGDAMRDPEVCFLRGGDGEWYPYSYRNDYVGVNQESADVDMMTGRFTWSVPRLQREHASFAAAWLCNVKVRQAPSIRALRLSSLSAKVDA